MFHRDFDARASRAGGASPGAAALGGGGVRLATAAAGDTDGLRGFRIPTFIVSPWSSAGVSHVEFDHNSILKLIEWRWNLRPLTARDASSDVRNLAFAFDLANPDPSAPTLPLPEAPPLDRCLIAPPPLEIGLSDLLDLSPF